MSTVTRILIDEITKRAIGVEFERKGKKYKIRANKEVLLSAGAINSPQILMLSGVGPKRHLEKLGIKVIENLHVGYNLQDHIALGGLAFIVNETVSITAPRILSNISTVFEYMANRNGPLSVPSSTEALALLDTNNIDSEDGWPDLELLFCSGATLSNPLIKQIFGLDDLTYRSVFQPIGDQDLWMVFPMLMRPKSKGRISLRSSNPYHKPLINANYMIESDDADIILKGVKYTIELSKTKAMQRFGSKLHDIPYPQCKHHPFGSDRYWKCTIEHFTQTIYHYSGTCKMGPKTDPESVVDSRLKVHGIAGLRVIDASIIPILPSAHTNTPTIMIAEKASDLIKDDWASL